jgi:hypothetical protein
VHGRHGRERHAGFQRGRLQFFQVQGVKRQRALGQALFVLRVVR